MINVKEMLKKMNEINGVLTNEDVMNVLCELFELQRVVEVLSSEQGNVSIINKIRNNAHTEATDIFGNFNVVDDSDAISIPTPDAVNVESPEQPPTVPNFKVDI